MHSSVLINLMKTKDDKNKISEIAEMNILTNNWSVYLTTLNCENKIKE